jgi:hypothetical protein
MRNVNDELQASLRLLQPIVPSIRFETTIPDY